ncbi:MAG: tyrosine-type recombinase/integrase [Verrucomicrobiota bacterium]
MKADAKAGRIEYKRDGITVGIRPTTKNGTEYFVLDYRVKGERKLVWRSSLADAKQAASDAIDKIVAGQADVLQLTNADAHVYLRAREISDRINLPLDHVARDYAEVLSLLAGRATALEACRDWLKRNNVPVPRKTVAEAVADCLAAAKADKKSNARQKQLSAIFDAFKRDQNVMVSEITPAIVSQWLAGLDLSERTRRNYRDVLKFLCQFCVLRGYLTKGTDWLENVQKYSARKIGEIEIYSPEELAKLLENTEDGMLPFVAIQAFAGLRHAEVARLDWSEIELSNEAGNSFIEVRAAKSKTGERRLVPVQDNLKHWLEPHRKPRGPVCEYANTTKQLLKIAGDAKVEWKHNGLRHSFISYRVAATADVPRVADEAGNSVQMIRQHYLRRVKPSEATKWFAIEPTKEQGKIVHFNQKEA